MSLCVSMCECVRVSLPDYVQMCVSVGESVNVCVGVCGNVRECVCK